MLAKSTIHCARAEGTAMPVGAAFDGRMATFAETSSPRPVRQLADPSDLHGPE